jgi:predicted acetyltransferase
MNDVTNTGSDSGFYCSTLKRGSVFQVGYADEKHSVGTRKPVAERVLIRKVAETNVYTTLGKVFECVYVTADQNQAIWRAMVENKPCGLFRQLTGRASNEQSLHLTLDSTP